MFHSFPSVSYHSNAPGCLYKLGFVIQSRFFRADHNIGQAMPVRYCNAVRSFFPVLTSARWPFAKIKSTSTNGFLQRRHRRLDSLVSTYIWRHGSYFRRKHNGLWELQFDLILECGTCRRACEILQVLFGRRPSPYSCVEATVDNSDSTRRREDLRIFF